MYLELRPSNLARNTSLPSSSQSPTYPLNIAKIETNQTASAQALLSASTTTRAVRTHVAAKQGATVATNNTTTEQGMCGRIAGYLHVRACGAPVIQQPALGLLPDSDITSDSKSKPQSTSSPEPQAEKDTQQTASQETASEPSDSQQIDSQQKNSQPTSDIQQIDSQPATPAVALAPVNSPVIVQGQTVPADGNPITVNNQLVRVASGSIYVGSSAAPIQQAQATQSPAEPIVAGTLTFQPASPSPVPQVAPSPVIIGGLTFSAAQSEPSVQADTAQDQPQAQPVVVGGKTYAPISPNDQAQTSQGEANTPNQGDSESASSHEQSNNAGQADSKPIIIGGMTYTPVAANPTTLPQNAAVFSFDGTALTQGGAAVTISGTRISLGPSGVVVGTSSLPFSTLNPTTSLLVIGSETLTALPGTEEGFEIGHSTLLPGSPAISIDGTIYSINKAGSLIVGTSTIALATAGSGNMSNSALTAGGETFTPLGNTAVVVDGSTLSIGGPAITEDGTRLSLASNGLLVGSSTYAYATPVINTATETTASSTFTTGVLPSGGTTPTAIASATGGATSTAITSSTGGVGKSAASGKTLTPGIIIAWVGISMCLSMMIRIL